MRGKFGVPLVVGEVRYLSGLNNGNYTEAALNPLYLFGRAKILELNEEAKTVKVQITALDQVGKQLAKLLKVDDEIVVYPGQLF